VAAEPAVSADTLALYAQLPEVVQQLDAAQPVIGGVQPFGYPLLCWLEGLCNQLQQIDDLCRDQGTAPGWSQLLDVTRCPTFALPWLAQWVGLRFSSAQLASDAQMRAAISAPGNFARGSIAGILAALAPYMSSTSGVVVLERTPDAYHLSVEIPAAAITDITYAELAVLYATYSLVDAAYPAYDDFPANESTVTSVVTGAIPAGLALSLSFI
jgi:hypothetical protein